MAISVVIVTLNSARHLEDTLRSVQGFNEVIVCDMESNDETLEIAARYNATILSFPRSNFLHTGPARNAAIASAKNDWVLVVRPDEIVPSELKRYLASIHITHENISGLYIPRKSYLLHNFDKRLYPDFQLRFFRKSRTWWDSGIYDQPIVHGEIDTVPAVNQSLALIRQPLTISEAVSRLNIPAYYEAEDNDDVSGKVSLMAMMKKTIATFFRTYVLEGAMAYGASGFIRSVNASVEAYVPLARKYENSNLWRFNRMVDNAISDDREKTRENQNI